MTIFHLITVPWWNACAYYAVTLASGLAMNGHRILFAGKPGSPALMHARKAGLRTVDNLHSQNFRNLYRLSKVIEDEAVDLIHAHTAGDHIAAAVLSLMSGRKPLLIRTLGDPRPPLRHIVNRWLHRRLTDGWIASAKVAHNQAVERLGITPEKITVAYAGLDLDRLRADTDRETYRRQLGITSETPLFGVIARLSPEKGQEIFIRAAALLTRDLPEVRFVISGEEVEPGWGEHLRRLSDDCGLEGRLFFLGRVNDVQNLIAALDVGVIPSLRSEMICRVAMEYMTLGIPVIGTSVNVIPEMVRDGGSGYIVPAGDQAALSTAMTSLARDRMKREAMGREAVAIANQRFSLNVFVATVEAAYQKAMVWQRKP